MGKTYKDRYGKPISEGDVVLAAITVNHDSFRGFGFATFIVRRKGRSLWLDGTWTTCPLRARPARELVKATIDVDLQTVDYEFRKEFGPR